MAASGHHFKMSKPGDQLSASEYNHIKRQLNRMMQFNRGSGQQVLSTSNGTQTFPNPVGDRWFYNFSGQQIPSYGLVTIQDVFQVDGQHIAKCNQPNTYGCQSFNFIVNGPEPVAANTIGVAQDGPEYIIAYNSGDTAPVFGDAWGPRNADFLARRNTGGFRVLAIEDTTKHWLRAVPDSLNHFLGQNLSGIMISQGSSGTIRILTGNWGSETDSGIDMPNVLARWGNIGVNAVVRCWCEHQSPISGFAPHWEAVVADRCA